MTPRRAARRDANESALIALARDLGAVWVQEGPLDGWLGWRGAWVAIEIKTASGDFTDSQVRFLALAKERHLPVRTWRTESDVLRTLGAVRGA